MSRLKVRQCGKICTRTFDGANRSNIDKGKERVIDFTNNDQSEIQNILDVIGASKTAKEIGIDCDLFTTFKATKDICDKYVLSRLLWDLDVIEEFNV